MLGPHSYQPPEDGLPPEQIRVQALRAEPWPDESRRVRIHLDITPFLERPNIDVSIADEHGDEVSSVTIIESIESHLVFTMHIRGDDLISKFTLLARLYYTELGEVDQKSINFEINPAT
jgi:hypothetical protein